MEKARKGIVAELLTDALGRTVSLADLLRKALVVARKLKIDEFAQWATSELDGYEDGMTVPQYRTLLGAVRAFNPYRGEWIPVSVRDRELDDKLSRARVGQGIATIQALHDRPPTGSEVLTFPFPPSMARNILGEGGSYLRDVGIVVDHTQLAGILDSVRTVIVNWSLKLEEDGIVGEDFTFTREERAAAANVVYSNVNNFHGTGAVAQVQQGSPGAVQNVAPFPLRDVGSGNSAGVIPEILAG